MSVLPEPTAVGGLPAIADVFEKIVGRILNGEETQTERRDFCQAHADTGNPSCDYNTLNQLWHCHTCNEHGGVLDLVVSAGKARSRREAVKWLRENGLMSESATTSKWDSVSVVYQYTNAAGILLYEVGRWNLANGKKDFRQRRPRPDGKEGFINDLKTVERVPYKLVELRAACERGEVVYITEGEKDADNLHAAFGVCATTSAQGAGWKWPIAWSDYFKGASRVVVLGDNDEPGIEAALRRASIIARAVPETYILVPIPGTEKHGDVSDWLSSGLRTPVELSDLVDQHGKLAEPYDFGYPVHAVHGLVNDMSDTGAADWFLACCGEDILWVPEYKAWLGWDGTRWTESAVVLKMVRIALDKMTMAARDFSGEKADDFQEWVQNARSYGRRMAMVECAKGERYAHAQQLDNHRDYLNLRNGILNCVTGELMEHQRDMLFTKVADVEYDYEATCPNFLAWLTEAMENDQERIDYIQQIMGGALVGRPGTRRMFFAYGPPGTGKSTITNVMMTLLGDYGCSIDFNVLAPKTQGSGSGPSPEIARLKGMRLITAVESRDNDRLDAARLKQFVGGDLITARQLNQGMVQFPIEGTLFMSGNSRPMVDADESLWSKLNLIPFDYTFPNQDINFFDRKLRPEMPGILRFAVEGLKKLVENDWRLKSPSVVEEATADYRDSENRILGFIEKYCEIWAEMPTPKPDPAHFRTRPADLREAYQLWIEGEHIRNGLGERAFANQLRRVNGVEATKSNGDRLWKGIRIRQSILNKMIQVQTHRAERTTQRQDRNDEGDF